MIARVVNPATAARSVVGLRGGTPAGSTRVHAMLLARRALAGLGALGAYDIVGLANASAAGTDPYTLVGDYNAWEGTAGVLAQIQAYQAVAQNLTNTATLQMIGSSPAGQALMQNLAAFPNPDSTRALNALTAALAAGKGQMGMNAPPAAAAGSLQWQTAGGNPSMLAVGDTWQLVVTGAPGAAVSVYGGKNGVFTEVQMGNTDASGVWRDSGAASSDQVGSWSETWKVNGQAVGQLAFTITPRTVQSVSSGPAAAPATYGAPATPGGQIPVSVSVQPMAPASGFSLSQPVGPLPLWAWLAIGGGGLFLMSGRGH